MATIESLQAQVIALQASEANLTQENEALRDMADEREKEFAKHAKFDIETAKLRWECQEKVETLHNKMTKELTDCMTIMKYDMAKVKSMRIFFEEVSKRQEKEIVEWKASDKHLNECINTIRDKYLEQKDENEKLKERLSIMKATASVHIDDINQIHQDYGNMVRELKKQVEDRTYERNNLRVLVKKLKEENEKLKAETDRLGKWKDYYEDLVGFGEIEHLEEKRKEYDPDFVPLSDEEICGECGKDFDLCLTCECPDDAKCLKLCEKMNNGKCPHYPY